MPLLKRFNFNEYSSVIIWKLEENSKELLSRITLHPSDSQKYNTLHHPDKQAEFLALRCCLKEYFGENPEVFYSDKGKPYLQLDEYISFSHTHGYAGMIVSKRSEVGIDLELLRPGIKKVAPKYMRPEEFKAVLPETETEQLIHYWGAKEVMVKITGNRRLHFKRCLRVSPFQYRDFQDTTGLIRNDEIQKKVKLYFKTIGELYLSFGWEIIPNMQ